jgi:hypothetical protein
VRFKSGCWKSMFGIRKVGDDEVVKGEPPARGWGRSATSFNAQPASLAALANADWPVCRQGKLKRRVQTPQRDQGTRQGRDPWSLTPPMRCKHLSEHWQTKRHPAVHAETSIPNNNTYMIAWWS